MIDFYEIKFEQVKTFHMKTRGRRVVFQKDIQLRALNSFILFYFPISVCIITQPDVFIHCHWSRCMFVFCRLIESFCTQLKISPEGHGWMEVVRKSVMFFSSVINKLNNNVFQIYFLWALNMWSRLDDKYKINFTILLYFYSTPMWLTFELN